MDKFSVLLYSKCVNGKEVAGASPMSSGRNKQPHYMELNVVCVLME